MRSFLEQVTAARRADAESRAAAGALVTAKEAATAASPPRDFARALSSPGLALIAEIKRASPSAGDINPGVDVAEQARAYERGGAAAISVLTEPTHFDGSLDDLRIVRGSVSVPVLRKDFISHPLQVWEARAAGADAILLIVAALDQRDLVSLYDLAETLGMAALVETHEADEVGVRDPDGRLAGYVQGDATLTCWHCAQCGCTTHWSPRDPALERMGVNLRLFDPQIWEPLPLRLIDGASW